MQLRPSDDLQEHFAVHLRTESLRDCTLIAHFTIARLKEGVSLQNIGNSGDIRTPTGRKRQRDRSLTVQGGRFIDTPLLNCFNT